MSKKNLVVEKEAEVPPKVKLGGKGEKRREGQLLQPPLGIVKVFFGGRFLPFFDGGGNGKKREVSLNHARAQDSLVWNKPRKIKK